MTTSKRVKHFVAAALICGACGDPPTSPSSGVAKLILSGPSTIAPGGSARYSVTSRKSDGSSSDVTASVTWAPSKSGVVAMGADGVASAVAPGEVDLRANYGGVSSPAVRITVLADGTFKVSGLITDSDAVQPIVGATVEIEQGIGAGLRSTTDANGAYALYGAAGEIRVAVSSPRFVSRNEAFTVSAPLTRNFVLSGEPSSSDLTGRWQLTFADPGCTALPEPMRTRQFTTTIAHSGSRAVLLLSGSTLIVTDPLNGRVFGDLLTVPLPHWPGDVIDAPYYAVLEQVHPGYLGIRGTITVALNGEGLDGTLDGALDYYPAAFTAGSAVGCSGPKAVKLRRQ